MHGRCYEVESVSVVNSLGLKCPYRVFCEVFLTESYSVASCGWSLTIPWRGFMLVSVYLMIPRYPWFSNRTIDSIREGLIMTLQWEDKQMNGNESLRRWHNCTGTNIS